MAIIEQLISITLKLLFFFVPEVLTWILIVKRGNRWSFRFGRVQGHPNLRPFARTWVVAIVIFIITLFSQDIFEFVMRTTIHDWLVGFGSRLGYFTLSLASFGFLWIYNYFLEKRWDKISWVTITIIILSGILFYI